MENQNKWTKKQKTYVLVGTLVGVGFILGARYQKKIDVKSVQRHLKEVMVFTKAAAPMFPNTMPISEIKELLSKLPDAQFVDALVTQVNGVQELIIRV